MKYILFGFGIGLGLVFCQLITGCERTTVSCQNPLGCDHEGHVIFRGIGD